MRRNNDDSLTLFGTDGQPLHVPAGYTSIVYDRKRKGTKTTVQIPDSGEAMGSVRRAVGRFPEIIGVDTSYRPHRGKVICATVVCKLTGVRYEGPRWVCEVNPLWGLEFHEPTLDAERIGWGHALMHGRALGHIGQHANTLLVVDAHLDSLHAINQRSEPVLPGLLLPFDVSIGYASADSTDSALNGLMARCDRFAKQLLAHVTSEIPKGEVGPLLLADRTAFGEYRYWTIG